MNGGKVFNKQGETNTEGIYYPWDLRLQTEEDFSVENLTPFTPTIVRCEGLSEIEESFRIQGIYNKVGEVTIDLHREILNLLLDKQFTADTVVVFCSKYDVDFLFDITSTEILDNILLVLTDFK